MSDSLRPQPSTAHPDSRRPHEGPGTANRDTPREVRVGAKALVRDGERALLVRERRADGSSFWTLPGGGVEPGETLPTCLRREITEEIRCGSSVGRTLATCTYRHTSAPVVTVYAVFAADLDADPRPRRAEGVVDCAWLAPGDLPRGTLTPIRRVVEDALDPS